MDNRLEDSGRLCQVFSLLSDLVVLAHREVFLGESDD